MKPELPDNHFPVIDSAIINPLTDSTWDESIAAHPDATVFHTSAWARVLIDTYGHRPFYLRLSIHGETCALVPMMEVRSILTRSRGICLPFSDSCAPLFHGRVAGDAVVKELQHLAQNRGWSYFEVRDGSILPEGVAPSESYWAHKLDLTKGDLPAEFSSSTRRALSKAKRSGLAAAIRTDREAMAQFYLLHVRTRRKHGVPSQPWAFFSYIQKHIIDAGLGFIITVERAKCPIAAAMFFKLSHHALYKFGASDERWQEFRPSNLAIAEAIKFLAASSVSTLHFGRTDKTNEGLRHFKVGWGAEEEQISYGKFAAMTDTWVQARPHHPSLYNRIFRALPAPMNRLAGLLLYPHLD